MSNNEKSLKTQLKIPLRPPPVIIPITPQRSSQLLSQQNKQNNITNIKKAREPVFDWSIKK